MPQLAILTRSAYPLRAPLVHFGPDSAACPDLPISTLMATDAGWDWIARNASDLDEATRIFADAVLAADIPPGHWITAHFPGGFTLATRGSPQFGVVSAALLELD